MKGADKSMPILVAFVVILAIGECLKQKRK